MKVIDGNKIADRIKSGVKRDLKDLKRILGFSPKIVSIVVGDNKSSLRYSKVKEKSALGLGFDFERKIFSDHSLEKKVIGYIKEKNLEREVCGIVVQLPLPGKFNTRRVLDSVVPAKDVDSLNIKNLEALVKKKPVYLPPVVAAVVEILKNINFDHNGKNVVIVGRGLVAGIPLRIYFEGAGSKVIFPSEENVSIHTKKADLLISATGVPKLIKKDFVKKGTVVIDVGYEIVNGKVLGDVDFEGVSQKASFITPVPGGVGPIVVASLLRNCLISLKKSIT